MRVVLISRGTMSGGRALAQCLAERLGLRSVAREDLIAVVDHHGEYAKKVVDSLGRATHAYEQFSQWRRPYLILMRHSLLQLVRQGNVVYHGYSAHLLLPGLACCLRVRINAPMNMRLRNAMERLQVPEAEARDALLKEDEERVRWARFMYGRDIRDPSLYDVTFSLERLKLPTICSMVASAWQEGSEFGMTTEAAAQFENLALATAVEAALVSDQRTSELEVGAKARDGNLLLEGPYLDESQQTVVLEIAKAVPGVTEVQYQPGCFPGFDYVT
jgi:hypothetical protein